MKMRLIHIFVAAAGLLSMVSGCDLNEIAYSQVTPDTFFTSPDNVYEVLARPFTHWYNYLDINSNRFHWWELNTDEAICPKRGNDWYNGGRFIQLYYHQWTPDHASINGLYSNTMQGVAYALDAKASLEKVDYEALGLTEEDRKAHLAQLDGIAAYFYLAGLDLFGGLPIYTDASQSEILPRSTEKELFDHIETQLLKAIEDLPAKKTLREKQDGFLRKGAAAMLLARLYFNAEKYLVDRRQWNAPADLGGVDYYAKCAQICQDLIDGKYGPYALEETWDGVFGFDNDTSPEAVWSIPTQTNYIEFSGWWTYSMPYFIYIYFDIEKFIQGNNGLCMTPSLDKYGNLLPTKLGRPYSKFNDQDLRKQPYKYLGQKQRKGLFIMGELYNPDSQQIGNTKVGAGRVYGRRIDKNNTLVLVDQIGEFHEVGKNKTYATLDDMPESISNAEETNGFRVVKWPLPNQEDKDIRFDPDYAYLRFAEVYYTLAECKMRKGDKAGAAALINQVRSRAFENRNDPDPVTAENLDMYRMLDEWMIEFLYEERRRTDLIRWDQFTEGEWWDHKPSKSKHLNRCPIPNTVIAAGQGIIEQNPGYGDSTVDGN